jgi:hypothetical protein
LTGNKVKLDTVDEVKLDRVDVAKLDRVDEAKLDRVDRVKLDKIDEVKARQGTRGRVQRRFVTLVILDWLDFWSCDINEAE